MRIASLSLFVFAKSEGAEAVLAGGPLGGKVIVGGRPGLLILGALVGWFNLRLPDELELVPELSPDSRLGVWLVAARETVLLVVFEFSVDAFPWPEAVKVRVKYCSSSVAHTETII